MNQTPEQFRVHCLNCADYAEKTKNHGWAQSMRELAKSDLARPSNDTQVLQEFSKSRRLLEIRRF